MYGWACKGRNHFGHLSKCRIGGVSIPDPPAVIALRSDFLDGNITPETGTGGTFSRTGSNYYYSSNTNTGIGLAGTGVACVEGFVYADTSFTNGGIQITGKVTNHCFQGSTPATSPWSTIGTAIITNSVVPGPDAAPTSAARLQLLAVGDGVKQQIAGFTNVSGRGFVFSVFLRSASSGSESIDLKAYNDTDTDSNTTTVSLNTTWRRVSVYVKFGIGISDGLRIELTGNGTLQDIYWWGAQLEECSATYGNMSHLPCNPVRTTVIDALKNEDVLTYPSSNLATLSSGSVNLWVAPFFASTGMSDESTDCEKYLFSINGTDAAITIGYDTSSNLSFIKAYYGGVSTTTTASSWTNDNWQMFTLTWSNLNPNISLNLYKDGALISSNTSTASPATISANTVYIGRATSGTNSTYVNGIVSLFKYYTGVRTASEISAQYTSELANF